MVKGLSCTAEQFCKASITLSVDSRDRPMSVVEKIYDPTTSIAALLRSGPRQCLRIAVDKTNSADTALNCNREWQHTIEITSLIKAKTRLEISKTDS